MRSWLSFIALLGGISIAAGAQERASTADQQALELAAAKVLAVQRAAERVDFSEWALDPRLYVRGVPHIDGTKPGNFAFLPPIEPTSEISAAHDARHLSELARVLGIGTVLDDASVCVTVTPSLCRLSTHRGLVTFTSAWISANKAELMVMHWLRARSIEREGTRRSDQVSAETTIFACERTNGAWRCATTYRIRS